MNLIFSLIKAHKSFRKVILKIRGKTEDDVHAQRIVSGKAWEDFCAISGQWLLRNVGMFLVADGKTDAPLGYTGLWFPIDLELPELCWFLFPGNMGRTGPYVPLFM